MPSDQWKSNFQTKATKEQINRYEASKEIHATHDTSFALSEVAGSRKAEEEKNDPCCAESTDAVTVYSHGLESLDLMPPSLEMTVGVLTVSDRVSMGVYEDASGPMVKKCIDEFVVRFPHVKAVVTREFVVPDEKEVIAKVINAWSSSEAGSQLFT
jgi:hypothetical protein